MPALTSHAPVVVNSDADLSAQGFTGSGALYSDPCVLENVTIDAAGANNGIYIGNVTVKYFAIRNVQIVNANGAATGPFDQGAGITIYKSVKGQVLNCNISSNKVGIAIYGGGDILVSQCSFFNNGAGVMIDELTGPYAHSTYVRLYRNYFGGSYAAGAYAVQAVSVTAVRIDGNKFRSTTANGGILLNNCSAISVVEDNDLRNLPETGITLNGGSNITVRNNNITGALNNGIMVGEFLTSTAPIRNLAIVGNDCSGVVGSGITINVQTMALIGASIIDNICNGGQYGIYADLGPNSRTNSVERNTCNDNALAGIRLIDFQMGTVRDNTCQNGGTGAAGLSIEASAPLPTTGTINNLVQGNTLSQNDHPLVVGSNNMYNSIISNDCSNGITGIEVQSAGNQIIDNVIYNIVPVGNNGLTMFGISIAGAAVSDNLVQGNIMTLPSTANPATDMSMGTAINVQATGIQPATNVSILYNQIGYATSSGIVTEAFETGEISGNSIRGCALGMSLSSSNGNIIFGNDVTTSTAGLSLTSSTGNQLTYNILQDISGIGLDLSASGTNTITNNLFSAGGDYAISLSSTSNGNSIHHNVFDNNGGTTAQALSDGTNVWSFGGQGNYWSEQTTPDSTNDGIVDSAYNIDGSGGEQDLAPLTFLVGPAIPLTATNSYRTVNLTWGASTYSTYDSVTEYMVYRNGTDLIATLPTGIKAYIDTNLTPGFTYTYQVFASTSGLKTASSALISVDLPAEVGPNEQVFTISTPGNGAVLTSGTVDLTWTSTAAGGTIYSISYDGGLTWASTTLLTYTIPVTLVDSIYGVPYTVYINASNALGTLFETQMVQFYVDATGPVITSNLAYQSVFANGSVPFSYQISDNPGTGVVNDTVYIDGIEVPGLNHTYAATPIMDYGHPVVIDLGFPTNLTNGTHVVTIYSADAAGHLSMVSFNVIVDGVKPTLIVTSDLGMNGNTNLPEVRFDWAGSSDPYTPLASMQFMVKADDGPWKGVGSATSYLTSTLQDGPHTFWLKAIDLAGNVNTTSISYVLDSVGPVITAFTPASGSALTGGTADLTWTASDGDGLGLVSHWYRLDSLAGENIYSSAPDQAVTLTNVPTGDHVLRIWAVDAAGNWGPMMALYFSMDASAPVTTAVVIGTAGTNGWYVSPASVTLTATDNVGVAKIQYRIGTSGPWLDYSTALDFVVDGTYVLQFNATDVSGIVEATKQLDLKIDTVAPETALTALGTPGANDWYQSSVTIGLASTDATSGVAAVQYDLDGSGWQSFAGNIVVSAAGSHTLSYRATDAAGNAEVTKQFTFSIDKAAPVTSMTYTGVTGNNGWNTTNVTVDLTAVDDVSGVGGIYYRVNGGAWNLYGEPIVLSGEWVNMLEYNATDIAGNVEATHTLIVKIDKTPPVTIITLAGQGGPEWFRSAVIATLQVTDPYSGVASTWYRVDGAGSFLSYGGPIVITGEGVHHLEYYALDLAGNIETVHNVTVSIDTVRPSLEIVRPSEGGITSGTANVSWSGSDSDSGVLGYSLKLDGGLWSDLITATSFEFTGLVNGGHTVSVRVTDLAGNTAERTVNFTADTIPPEVVTRSPEGSTAPINSEVSAVFSEAMDQANTSISVNGVTGTISWAGNKIVITPDANLVYNTTFTVTVNGRDAVGNPLPTTTWTFSTIAGKGTLIGTVNGPDGKPIAGATVYLGDQNTTTDAQGRYLINVTQGDYTMIIKAPGMVDQTKQVTILPDQTADSGTVSLSKAPGIDAWVWIVVVLAIVIVLVAAFVMYQRRSGEKK